MRLSTEIPNVAHEGVSAKAIFEDVWSSLENKKGEECMRMPKEIMWLGGAPGSGKGTNTNFIMRERGLTAPPIVVSDLLSTPAAEELKARGELIGDLEVTELLFKELLNEKYETGVVVDGFPRTPVQAEITSMLYTKMTSNYRRFSVTEHSSAFPRPIFRICVLFVDMMESVSRQLARGQSALAHNKRVKESGEGVLKPERKTDFDQELAKKRYVTFRDSTFKALEQLGELFIYNVVHAMGSFEQVEANIRKEMDYQSRLELNPETHEAIHHLPRASEIVQHARQHLVSRLDAYSQNDEKMFREVVDTLEDVVYPVIARHALTGKCELALQGTMFEHSEDATNIALCILSDRGFRVNATTESHRTDSKTLYFVVEWDSPKLRSG